MANVPYDGREVKVGQTTYTVPALTVKQVKQQRQALAIIPKLATTDPTDEEVDALMGLVLVALNRNYPNLTLEELEEAADLNSLPLLVAAVTGQTGLQKPASGEV